MTPRVRAILLMLAAAGLAPTASAADSNVVEANRLEYRLGQLEQRTGALAVSQAVLRQQLLDAGPELGRKACDGIKLKMSDPGEFKFLHGLVKDVEKSRKRIELSAAQLERLAAVKGRLARLDDDAASVDCKALTPLNP